MAVPKRRTAKSASRSRRAANNKVAFAGFVKCPNCNEPKLAHRVCPDCGHYNGKEVVAK
ncbi:50S ribosomal protein L32 [Peptostreptococcaceae bacterium AGR-M142]